ncbi:peptide chain release factor subunit 1 [Streptomyces sp. DvalAA-14]|uniref:baeRF10 domain-containing protein n=1 Tax=unclassified Streptomyces TaxID=2593676 RepID=UPI00081B6B1F|nr:MULTISPECIES: hypothetical protein [unclassified Streptomyces]MYS22730.1 hypothetical protein [Streptomyces sp. SID4948]SCE21441.1 peptide chain release factor subunit 1 [Streptomyces sp. DvalAA-14]
MITQETIDRLVQFEESRFPVVSVYAQVDVDQPARLEFRARVLDLLDRIRPMAEDRSLDRDVRMSVRDDLARIMDAVVDDRKTPGAVAFFSCSGRNLFEEVALPRPVHDRIVQDATPWIRPLVATLEEYHRTCAVLVDRSRVRSWEFYLDEMRETDTFRDPFPRTTGYPDGRGGDRLRHKADEMTKHHYRRVAELLTDRFRRGEFELLAVGGQADELPAFLDCLPADLRVRLAGTFTADMDSATPAEVRASARAVLESHDRAEEKRLVDECLDAAAAGQPAAVGLDDSLWAGSVAAARSLLVQDGETVPGVVCDRDGWLALSGTTCPLCGEAVRQTPDVVDELVAAVIEDGGSIEHVRAKTPLREHVAAATLRFPLPPRPGADD